MKSAIRTGGIIVILSLLIGLFAAGIPLRTLAAGNGTNIGDLSLYPRFENIAVMASFTDDDNGNNQAVLEYKETTSGTWKPGITMTVDRRDTLWIDNASLAGFNPIEIPNTYKNQWRAVIFGLTPNTSYNVRVTYSDADGITGTNPVTGTVTTSNDNPPSTGTTYYVDGVNGDDAKSGLNEANAWKTIQKAVNTVSAGATVRILPGIYTGQVFISGKSGAADNYITFRSHDSLNKAIVTSGALGTFRLINSSYIRLKELDISNTSTSSDSNPGPCVLIEGSSSIGNIVEDSVLSGPGAAYTNGGVVISSGAKDTLVQRNQISTTATGSNGPFGVFFGGSGGGNVARDNTITGGFYDGIGGSPNFAINGGPYQNSFIYRNTIDGAQDDGIEAEGGGINCAVYDNTIRNTGNAFSTIAVAPVIVGPLYVLRNTGSYVKGALIKLGSSSYGFLYFYHNTLYSSGTSGNISGAATYGSDKIVYNAIFRNNIFQVNTTYVVEEESGGTGTMDFDWNDMYSTQTNSIKWLGTQKTWANWRTQNGKEPNGVWETAGSAQFVNAAAGDFNLQATALAINKGIVLKGFNDVNAPAAWTYKGLAPDMGALEYGAEAANYSSPVLTAIGNKTAVVGQPLQFTISATDVNNDPLTYSASNLPSGATFNSSTRTFSWTPSTHGNFINIHFEVSDGSPAVPPTDSEDISITVSAPPVLAAIGNKFVIRGQLLQFTVSATDADSTPLTYSASNLPSGATFNTTTRTFSWTPSIVVTVPNVHFQVTDGLLTDFEDITITVSAPPPPPSDGGGGGGGGGGGAGITMVIDSVDQTGKFSANVTARSDDQKVVIQVPKGTNGTRAGALINYISIVETESITVPMTDARIVGMAYALGPVGTKFNPAVSLTFSYDPAKIPKGMGEKSLVIGYADVAAGKWVPLSDSVADTVARKITAKVDHFSLFAVLAYQKPAAFNPANLAITPVEVNPGEDVIISVDITNTGNLEGKTEVVLKIDGQSVETREVTIAGGDTAKVNFTATSNSGGIYNVDVNGLTGTFTVKAPPPPPSLSPTPTPAPPTTPAPTPTATPVVIPPPAPAPPPEISRFSATPDYDTSGKLASVKIEYQVSGALPDAKLMLKVLMDNQPFDEVRLAGEGSLAYVPPRGWQPATYSFRAELSKAGSIVRTSQPEQVTVTPGPGAIAAMLPYVAGAALALITIVVGVALYRRRVRGY